MRRPSRKTWGVGLVALAALVFAAGCVGGPTETRNDSFAVGSSPRLVVDSENGRIVVSPGPSSAISVRATLSKPNRMEYKVTQDGDTIQVEAKKKGGFRLFDFGEGPGAEIEITTPATTVPELTTSNGSITVRGINQSGRLRTSNGKVVMEDVKGDFAVRTSNGSIELSSVEGRLDMETSNGSVVVREGKGEFDIETSNGRIEFMGGLVPGGQNRFKTSNGSVSVRLAGEPSVRLDASTSNGEVTTRLPILTTSTGDEGRLVGDIGDAEADLTIRTSNGEVTIQ